MEVRSRDLTFEVEVYAARQAELDLRPSISQRAEALRSISIGASLIRVLVASTHPEEGDEVEEAIFAVDAEEALYIEEEVEAGQTIADLMTDIVGSRCSTEESYGLSVVIELTTLQLKAHPEGRTNPATYSERRIEVAHAITELLHIIVIATEAERSSIPYFEEPVRTTILDKSSLTSRLLSGLLSLQGTRSSKSAECKLHYFRIH